MMPGSQLMITGGAPYTSVGGMPPGLAPPMGVPPGMMGGYPSPPSPYGPPRNY